MAEFNAQGVQGAGGAATTGTGRVGNVDVLRAAAAFSVLAGHAYVLGGRDIPLRAERWYDVPLLQTATGVWLFFAISGYVISKPFVDRLVTGRPLPDLVPYAIKRALRIFPLYWIALAAVLIVYGAGVTNGWHYPFHFALLHNLVPGRQGSLFSVAWTLTLEVLFYIAMPLLALAVRRAGNVTAERLAGLVLATWLASILATAGADLYEVGLTGTWLRGSFPTMWQMFCPDILLAIAPHLREPAWRRWLVDLPAGGRALPLAAACLLVAAILYARPPLRFGLNIGQLTVDGARPLFAIGYGLVLAKAVGARAWFEERARFVLHLGLISYGVYLWSAVLLYALVSANGERFVPLPSEGLAAYLVHLAFLAGLTVLLAMASWRWFELPFIRLASTLGDRWNRRTGRVSAPARGGRDPGTPEGSV